MGSACPSPSPPPLSGFVVWTAWTARKYMKKVENTWETEGRCLRPCDKAEVLISSAFLAGREGRERVDCYRIRSPHLSWQLSPKCGLLNQSHTTSMSC